jgi:hypothetical protein
MHLLMQDVRTAYWRAASAQVLRAEVQRTIALAEEALADSRKVEEERVRNPLDALRYQRQLLENLRLLEAINQELLLGPGRAGLADQRTARCKQSRLPMGERSGWRPAWSNARQQLEEVALAQQRRPARTHYNARIAREETARPWRGCSPT